MSTDESGSGAPAAVIVLAAGPGTRMRSGTSKLLHQVAGRSMLGYAMNAAIGIAPEQLVVVVGHLRDQVERELAEVAPQARTAVQAEQHGTGDAVICACAELPDLDGEVVITYADVPMLDSQTLLELLAAHRAQHNLATVLTAHAPDPTGYGRIVRDVDGQVERIVEHKDATAEERAITEINSGIYVFDAALLRAGLGSLRNDNAQGEYYLTDVVGYTRQVGGRVGAHVVSDLWRTMGVNDRVQLAQIHHEMNRRIVQRWMLDGVSVIDPATTWIDDTVSLAPDVTVLPNTQLHGATTISAGATIGPDTTLSDVEVGPGATIVRTHGSLAVIGAGASVGPFSYLRPGTELGADSKVGAFVETKNTRLGEAAKLPHLSYAGDAVIGPGANIGAGVVFANYDGVAKHTTTVGEASFVGSDSVLVAPVHVAAGSYVAAGSVITDDVAPGELAVARGQQRNIDGWVGRKRAGTVTAAAAKSATSPAGERAAASTTAGDQEATTASAGEEVL